MLTNIIFPMDGSNLAEKAFPYALTLAAEFKSELLLFRVAEEGETAEAKEYLERFQNILNGMENTTHAGFKVLVLTATGNAGDEILQAAENFRSSLIIMSTHGRSGLSRVFNGSVAEYVLSRSSIPVMLIHPQDNDGQDLSEFFKTFDSKFLHKPIVVPLDGTKLAELALTPALELAQAGNVPLRLLQVLPGEEDVKFGPYPSATAPLQPMMDMTTLKEEALDYLLQVETDMIPDHHHIETHVIVGNPVQEIVKHAKTTDSGLIVMASHARTGIGKTMLGSVAGQVMKESGLPVVIVNGRLYGQK
jgi:nucleotide-binding universal stress UspA family protein